MNNKDQNLCQVLEFEEPKVRTIQSLVICHRDDINSKNFKLTLATAYLKSLVSSNIRNDIPMAHSLKEKFTIAKTDEQDQEVVKTKIVLGYEGASTIIGDNVGSVTLSYREVLPDKNNKPCGFWYK